MAEETSSKVELSKDILAPAEGPREELISTAVKFLQNPKVQQSSLTQRKAFLERKGLTKDEIDIAVQRSGVPLNEPTQVYPPQPPGIQQPHPGAVIPYQQPVPALSTFDRVRDILHTIALIGGLSYAAYKFFKEVLQPWILGKPKTDERLDRIEDKVIELQQNIVETLSKIQLTLTTMQESMSANQEKIQAISHEVYSQRSTSAISSISETQFATEVKTELQTLKGLLLNRRQFPRTPSSSSPSLPAWQLEQTVNADKSNLVKPSGDASSVSEEANLNKNESDRTDQDNDEHPKVTFTAGSLEETEDIVKANQPIKTLENDIDENQSEIAKDKSTMQATSDTES